MRKWTNGVGYDLAGRLTNVTSQAGSFGYELGAMGRADALIKRLRLPGGAAIVNGFDEVGRLIGTFLTNSTGVLLNKHEYSHNQAGQREQQIFPDNSYANYLYDGIGQLTNADSSVGLEGRSYGYDTRWNLTNRLSAGTPAVFLVDHKNQLTNAAGSTLGYDANGNLTTQGGLVYTWDDESRLVRVSDESAGHTFRTEFVYDGFGRMRKRLEYTWVVTLPYTNPPPPELESTLSLESSTTLALDESIAQQSQVPPQQGTWQLGPQTWYFYDGFRVIQERDSNSVPVVSYTRGRDLSGSLQGAGGIGGLLGRSHGYSGGNWSAHNYYHADGGGNVTCMIDGSQAMVANYRYDPFGNLVSKSGPLADANVYRFSSKEQHLNSGLYYYGYRFYSPNLQRWINPDPIGERGGMNLYGFLANDPISHADPFGLTDAAEVAKLLAEMERAEQELGRMMDAQKGMEKNIKTLEEVMSRADPKSSWYEQAEGWKERLNENLTRNKGLCDQKAANYAKKANDYANALEDYKANRWHRKLGRGLRVVGEGVLQVIVIMGTRMVFFLPALQDPTYPNEA